MAFSYHLHVIGTWHKGPEKALFDHYTARLKTPLKIHEYTLKKEQAKIKDVAKIKQVEAALLLPVLEKHKADLIYALDERGQQVTSHELAKGLDEAKTRGAQGVHFIIGGAYGFAPDILTSNIKKMAFGKATWPHLLVRGMIAEQLYRCETILSNHPYHK